VYGYKKILNKNYAAKKNRSDFFGGIYLMDYYVKTKSESEK